MTVGFRSSEGTPLYFGHSGTREVVSWAGADAPASEKRPPRRKPTYGKVPREILVPIRKGKHAGQLRKKIVYFRVLLNPGDPFLPFEKRKRVLDDHDYHKDSLLWHSVAVTPKNWYGPQTKGSDWIWATLGGEWPLTPLLDDNDQNKLISKLWTRVKGSDFNAANFLGESHQTLALIADTAIRVAKSYFHIRKGDASGALRSLVEGTSRAPLMNRIDPSRVRRMYPNLSADVNSQARLLLEFQYGWRPLINDVVGAAEMLSQELSVPRSKVERVKVEKNGPSVRKVDGNFWTSSESWFGPGGCEFPSVYKHTRKIKAIFTEEDLPSLPARLGLTNPETVLWELTPFSFVADWFLPIGPALEARAAASNLRGKFVVTDFLLRSESSAKGFYGTLEETLGSCPGNWTHFTLTRTVTNSLTSALPSFKPLNKALSMEHCLNAVALVTSAATLPLGALKSSIMRNSALHSTVFR